MKILFLSGYNLKDIRVSLEISLLSSFYLLRFFVLSYSTFHHADTEKSYALWVMSYNPGKSNYFKDFIFLFF